MNCVPLRFKSKWIDIKILNVEKNGLDRKQGMATIADIHALPHSLHRLLFGVMLTGTQVLPGVDVGGKGLLSGTAAKLSRAPPLGPTSRKMPPLLPVLVPGFFPAVIHRFLFSTALTPRYVKPRNCQALGAWVTLNVPKRELGADFAGIGTLPRLPRVPTSRWPFFILGLNPVRPLYLWSYQSTTTTCSDFLWITLCTTGELLGW